MYRHRILSCTYVFILIIHSVYCTCLHTSVVSRRVRDVTIPCACTSTLCQKNLKTLSFSYSFCVRIILGKNIDVLSVFSHSCGSGVAGTLPVSIILNASVGKKNPKSCPVIGRRDPTAAFLRPCRPLFAGACLRICYQCLIVDSLTVNGWKFASFVISNDANGY